MSAFLPFLIIAAAVALVVGPVMLMRPSKQQQRQSRLRSKAMAIGMRVQMMPLPAVGGASKAKASQGTYAAYCLPWGGEQKDLAPWLLVRGPYAHELNFSGVWQWPERLQAGDSWHPLLLPLLEKLPVNVMAVGNGPQGLSFYWDERGGEEDVEQLGDFAAGAAATATVALGCWLIDSQVSCRALGPARCLRLLCRYQAVFLGD